MLKALGDIKNPELIDFDRDSLKAEIEERILGNPDYANIYDGNLYQNASQMILNFFTFLFEKNAESFNKISYESFLQKCRSDSGIYARLRERNIQIYQDHCASTKVLCTVMKNISNTNQENNAVLYKSLIIPRFSTIKATGLDGSSIPFEFIRKKDTGVFDYFNDIIITPTDTTREQFELELYAGETFVEEVAIPATGIDNSVINLSQHTNVVNDSIIVFYKTATGLLIELPSTSTFVKPLLIDENKVFTDGKPYYILNYTANGSFSLTFGSAEFGGAFSPEHYNKNQSIVIYGRKNCGGKYSNIVKGAINGAMTFSDVDLNTFEINIVNSSIGAGGADRETTAVIKAMAPTRYGRSGGILDDQDAKSALKQFTVKHEITVNNIDGENPQITPNLHVFHKIAPQRDFSAFVFPDIDDDETASTYKVKLINALYNFCNIQGINATAISNELLTDFVSKDTNNSYDFKAHISGNKPLFGTLDVNALDYNGKIVDKLMWKGDYNVASLLNTSPTEHAVFLSAAFDAITLTNNVNNCIKFYFGDSSDEVFEIKSLIDGARSPQSLVSELSTKIRQAIVDQSALNRKYASYINFTFVEYVEETAKAGFGRIKLICPLLGVQSKITFAYNGFNVDTAKSLPALLGYTVGIPYRPVYETRLVFNDESIYYPDDKEVLIKVKPDFMDSRQVRFPVSLTQPISSEAGPTVSLTLIEEDKTTLTRLQEDSNIKVELLNNGTSVEIHSFNSVSDSMTNEITLTNGASSCITAKSNFNYSDSCITLQFVDGKTKATYIQSFSVLSKIVLFKADSEGNAVTSITPLQFNEINGNWTQQKYTLQIPTCELQFENELETSSNYLLVCYTSINNIDTEIQSILFTTGSSINIPVIGQSLNDSETAIVVDTNQPILDLASKKITINFAEGTEDTSTIEYEANFLPLTEIWVTFNRKSYDKITIDYSPNIYNPEGEALSYVSILKDKSKRLLALEHLLKPIEFIPIGIQINATIFANYSTNEAKSTLLQAAYDCIGYGNANANSKIGSEPTVDMIRSYLIDKSTSIGLKELTITGLDQHIKANDTTNAYYFAFDSAMKQRMVNLETTNTTLAGLSSITSITVNITKAVA